MDLHIGVTDSSGAVVEFDKHGLQKHKASSWNQCLVLDGIDELWSDHWDEILQQVIQDECWTSQK